MQKRVIFYCIRRGKSPFGKWLAAMHDRVARARITTRIDRMSLGFYGDHKFVAGKLQELRIHYGPGYRVYYANLNNEVVLILLGGTKRTQQTDIVTAKRYLENFQERANHVKKS